MEGFTLETLARELSTTTTYILLGSTNELDHEHEVFQAEMAAVFRQLSLPDKETLLRMARGLLP
jgi:hypothetical protein